jgi:hypothetical protein
MGVAEVTQTVVKFCEEVMGKAGRVVAVEPDGEGRRVLVEIVEESEYMRRLGKSEMLGVYEVYVDPSLNVISYSRIGLRDRAAAQMITTDVS